MMLRETHVAHRPRRSPQRRACARGFTLAELLVVIGIIALLLAVLLPALRQARSQALRVACGARLLELARGLHHYAAEHNGRAMPLAYWQTTAEAPHVTYWWGVDAPGGADVTGGMLWPYLRSDLTDSGVFGCPVQPRGTYDVLQGSSSSVTSTYGYNGYFLSPAFTPGWAYSIGHRPWQNLDTLRDSSRVLSFTDTMVVVGGALKNSALLDPPWLYQTGGGWVLNKSPTTAFRHSQRTAAAFVDGHVEYRQPSTAVPLSAALLGSLAASNDPHYVPDWESW